MAKSLNFVEFGKRSAFGNRPFHAYPNPLVFFPKKVQLRWYPAAFFSRPFGPKKLRNKCRTLSKYKFWREEAILLTIKNSYLPRFSVEINFLSIFGE